MCASARVKSAFGGVAARVRMQMKKYTQSVPRREGRETRTTESGGVGDDEYAGHKFRYNALKEHSHAVEN